MILPFLVEFGASLVGGLGGRAIVGQALKKVAPKVLKHPTARETLLGAGEILGVAGAIGTLKGGEKEDYREALKGATTGFLFGQTVYYPIKYSAKAVGKAIGTVPKEIRDKFNPVKLFVSDLSDEEKSLLLKHTQPAQRIFEIGSHNLHNLYKKIFHSEELQAFTKELFSRSKSLQEFYEWELKRRVPGERVSEIAGFEYLLLFADDPIVKNYAGLRQSILDDIIKNPLFKEKKSAFLQVRELILKRAMKENPEEAEIIQRLLGEAPPEHVIAGYFPRFHVKVPYVKEPLTELVEDPYNLLSGIRTMTSTEDVLSALKPREFPSLLHKINHAIVSNVPFESISYKRGSNTFRAFLSGYTVPNFLRGMFDFVQEAKEKGIVASKITPELIAKEKVFVRFLGADVPERINKVIKNMFYTYSGMFPSMGALPLSLSRINMFMKHFALAMSPFHSTVLTISALTKDPVIAVNGMVRGTINALTGKSLDDVARNVYEGIADLNRKGVSTQFTLGIPEGYDVILDNYQKLIAKLGAVDFVLNKPLQHFVRALAFPTKLTWDGFFRAYKLLFADELIRYWRKGVITDDELASGLNAINDVFGGAYFWRFMSPEATQLLRLIFFAPDWYVSLWKNYQAWISDESIFAVDFIPTLARIHMYLALAFNHYMNPDENYFDKLFSITEKTAYALQALKNRGELNPLSYYAVLRHYYRDLFTVSIPVRTSSGQIKVLKADFLKVEAEPEEMIGFHQLMENIAKQSLLLHEDDMIKALDVAGGGLIKYWLGKASSVLRAYSNIATSFAYAKTPHFSDIFLRIFTDTLPMSVTSSWKAERYIPAPDDEEILKIMLILRNFSFVYRTEHMGEYLAPKLLSENPQEVQGAIEMIRKQMPLRALPYLAKGDLKRFSIKRTLTTIEDQVVRRLYNEYGIDSIVSDIIERRVDGEDITPLVEHLRRRHRKALERIDRSALPKELKSHLKQRFLKHSERQIRTMLLRVRE
jgi:hypothetical protein